jgi:hypothetical protein
MKPELDPGRLFAALGAALLLACASTANARVRGQEPRAEKLGEYVNQFTSCNAGAHLDDLAIHLQNNPASAGYVRIYGPGGPDDSFGKRAATAAKNYLVMTRGIDESRVKAVYAGRYARMDEVLTELWLVPEGAEPPPPTKYEPDLEFEGKFVEVGTWDGPDEHEGWSTPAEVALVGLSDMMRRRANARAYLVAYQTDESAPGAWRRAADSQGKRLADNGVAPERVRVIFGGYAEEERVKVWILPPNAPPPAKQKRERRPERSVRIASLADWQLKYGDAERWGFLGLAGLLKADAQLTGCIVVRQSPPMVGAVDPETPVDPGEPPDVDVLKLVEQWKQELKKGGVGEHRLIVMVAPAKEDQTGGEIETWVVPPGAPLPDPSAGDAIDAEEAEEENPKEF